MAEQFGESLNHGLERNKMNKIFGTLAMVAVLQVLPSFASAAIIDFEDLNNNGTGGFTLYGDNFDSGGYNFASVVHAGDNQALASWTIDLPSFYTGTIAPFMNYSDDEMNMTKVGGGAFDVGSIDLTDVFRDGTLSTVDFVGTRADSSTVTQSVFVADGVNLQTYALNNMTNIVSLGWKSVEGRWTQFDNINIVPEPASMTVLGIAALAMMRKRRQA